MIYSISELEQLSGISVHNIRIWERRYHALSPLRSAGNTRYYDDDQLKRLLNLASLYRAGFKISKVCAMSDDEIYNFLQSEVDETVSKESRFEYLITKIISSGIKYDEFGVNELINQSFRQSGVLDTYKFVMYPLFVRLGLMWRQDSLCPSQEHFLSSIFRQKLYAAIDNCPPPEQGAKKWLLFLPEDEGHDIGLLLANYLLRAAYKNVIYLGPKVPLSALKNTVESTNPDNLLFFMTRMRPVAEAQEYLKSITETFSQAKIYFSGNPKVFDEFVPEGATWLRGLPDFENIIEPKR